MGVFYGSDYIIHMLKMRCEGIIRYAIIYAYLPVFLSFCPSLLDATKHNLILKIEDVYSEE